MKKNNLLIIVFAPMVLIFTFLIFNQLFAYTTDAYREGEVIAEVRNKILSYYVEKVESKKILKGALEGMVSTLDPHSSYLDEEEYKQIYESTSGEFVGIGIEITVEDNFITIIAPIDSSPAAKAGILAGDKILEIDGKSAEGISLNDAVARLRGKQHTKVVLKVMHEGSTAPDTIEIVRDTIQIRSVKNVKIIDSKAKIGYIRLVKFNSHTYEILKESIEKLKKQDMKGLILDLRFNPGGLLDAAVLVVNSFITDGTIVYTKGRIPSSQKLYRAKPAHLCWKKPLVIIVNKASASASEIVAGALQDYRRAIVIGSRTYGKGSVQSILSLRDEKSGLKLTTAKYYTPSGRSIQKGKDQEGGVTPDVLEVLSQEELRKLAEFFANPQKNPKFVDKQLNKAINILKKKSVSFKFR